MDYDACRRLSSSQFGRFSISERAHEQEILHRVGEAFQQIRTEQAQSVDELAAATGVPATRIHALEAGELDPDYALLLALADALGVPSAAFVVRSEELAKENSNEG
jgi:transcriptional regulator with XRE-family HTH domain